MTELQDGQIGQTTVKEENNVEGFENSFFNEPPPNTSAGKLSRENGR